MNRRQLLIILSLVLSIADVAWNVSTAQAGPGGGTYYANSPAGVQGTQFTGKPIRKFVDSLPGLGLPGCDPTPVTGTCNANNLGQYISIASRNTASFPNTDYYEFGLRDYTERMHSDLPKATRLRGYIDLASGASPTPHYLGPLIIAQRDRPVRIKFINQLGVNGAGDLFLPVDTTVMGAGMGPDGMHAYTQNRATIHLHGGNTPWISDGTPHQWTVPAGDSTLYQKGVSTQDVPDMPKTGPGEMTFFYPNQQSGRLMFYHDHTYGMTRLNVYAGEAAGYLLVDQVEEDLISGTNVSGVNSGLQKVLPDLGGVYHYGIPLIIQDKTFVPQNIAVQDSKWDTFKWGQPGDLWFPHVYEPNQMPNDPSGANPFGRWDYGPWFWPPVIIADPAKATLPEPSIVPEGFMDTALVNGTAYPYLQVARRAYRFRILNACNDRMLNLQLYYADPANPAEVKMVPALPNMGLPPSWPTDGRDGGVPDPTLSGPEMIQIGTEGGFLPQAVVLPNTPVGYEYNRRNIVVLNVSNKTLFLGPAERADVIIDFSTVPDGSKIILYNDAPAPVPAFDPRNDYYTGDPDQTVNGGAPPTLPGFGPNTRTIMQFVVSGATASAPFSIAGLTAAMPAAFAASQPAPIIPESTYPAPYTAATDLLARIQDFSLTFTPWPGVTGLSSTLPITIPMQPKAIQELWDPYGRMNATLGVELPFTNNNIQTTIPLGYVDPITEAVPDGQTQLWKITHNGVDTHAVHFHLVNVQVINRVGWDGAIRPPDDNELGWKETVRMHPLEDIIVALQPKSQTGLPFAVPTSMRSPDVTSDPTSTITVINPVDGNAISISNEPISFGWEYVWHCHLLGHEENDMMRPFVLLVSNTVPTAPSGLFTTPLISQVTLTWADNSDNEIGFRVMRDGTLVAQLYSNVTEWTDPAVSSNTTYTYQVFAYNAIGDSLPTALVPATTLTWSPASGVTITASPMSALTGTAVVFTASGSGSTAPYQYRFLLSSNGTNTTIVQDYSPADTWTMLGTTPSGTYTITVDVRTSSVTAVPEASASMNYVLGPLTPTGATVMASAGPGGTILPSGTVPILLPASPVFAITPNACYGISNVLVDNVSVGTAPTYTFTNISANHTIAAAFSQITYTIMSNATSTAGTIIPSGATIVNCGSSPTFTVTPGSGYHITSVTGCGGTLNGNAYTLASVGSNCTVTADFALSTYAVTPSAGPGGSISPAGAQIVSYGSTTSFTITPDTGYHIVSVSGCNGTLSGAYNNTFVTDAVTSACTVTASFALPDGNLGNGVTINDAQRALMIASGVIAPTVNDMEHGDVAPLVGGKPQPDGKIDIGDVVVILRKIVGLVNW